MKPYALLLFTLLFLCGCAKDSGILIAKDSESIFKDTNCPFTVEKSIEDTSNSEHYRYYQQGATGFVPSRALVGEIEQQSFNYCSNLGKKLKVLKITTTSAMSLPGCFPRAELEFICADNKDVANYEDKLFIRLTNLKKLLDNGTITKDEFDKQKADLLANH